MGNKVCFYDPELAQKITDDAIDMIDKIKKLKKLLHGEEIVELERMGVDMMTLDTWGRIRYEAMMGKGGEDIEERLEEEIVNMANDKEKAQEILDRTKARPLIGAGGV